MADDFKVRFELDVTNAQRAATALAGSLTTINTELIKLDKTSSNNSKTEQQSAQAAQQRAQATQQGVQATQQATLRTREFTRSNQQNLQSLSTTRYALYDVSRTLGVVGAALVGVTAATFGVSIAMEREFANVVRTSDVTGSQVDTLRNNFIALAQQIPITFAELTRIGTLGGQLGIAASELAEFTSVVARFTAVTDDMSEDQVAVAFGRLRALLPDIADGTFSLEQLGSAIQLVGINAVASEGEIVNVAVQLSSMAGYAGLTAAELVGLASALASVGVKPELARGTITRVFIQMGRAVSDAGDKLDTFARVAGVSSEEFASAFGTDRFGPVFLSFVEGLGSIQSSGSDVVATLNDLGIASVRDIPALTRLASGYSSVGEAGRILRENIDNANQGIQEGTELARQYGIINDTVASKLQIFANNFQNLLFVIGQGGGVFGGALDFLNDMLATLTRISQDEVVSGILQVSLILAGIVGTLALMGAAAAAGYAGLIGINQALVGVAGAGGLANVGLGALQANLVGVGVSASTAAVAVNALRFGIYGLVGLVSGGAMLGLASGLTSLSNSVTDLFIPNDFLESLDRINQAGAAQDQGFISWMLDVQRGLDRWGFSTNVVARDLNRIDDELASMVASGRLAEVNQALEESARIQGITVEHLLNSYPELRAQLELVGNQSGITAQEVLELADAESRAAEAAADLRYYLDLTEDEFKSFVSGIKTGSSAFVGVGKAVKDLTARARENAQAQADATKTTKDSWEDYYKAFSINDVSKELERQAKAHSEWARDISELTARGATSFAGEIARMGPEGAALAAQAVDLVDEELLKLEERARLAAFLASDAFAEAFAANDATLVSAFEAGGIEAVRGLIRAQMEEARTGVPGAVKTFVDTWNSDYRNNPIIMPIGVDTDPATIHTRRFLDWANRQTATISVAAVMQGHRLSAYADAYFAKRASGGPVYGPGTGTSDSIPAMLSNGEYVIRASSVRQYGHGFLDAVNRGVAKFAQGGPVGGGAGSSAIGMGVMELGPKSLGRMGGGSPVVNVYLDDIAIAKAAQRGQKQLTYTGAQ